MSYHLALAICKVPRSLGPGSMEKIRRRISKLEADPERAAAMADAVAELDPDAYEEIYEGLVARDLAGASLEEAVVAAIRPLAVLWLGVAVETLIEPLVEPVKRLPYDVREETLDGNRYLFSGTVTSGDANESYGLVRLLEAGGVTADVYDGLAEDPDAPDRTSLAVVGGALRCSECGYQGDEHGGFSAIGDALVTAQLNRSGTCETWKNAVHHDANGYREVLCDACGADLGDLTPEDLDTLNGEGDKHHDQED